MSQWCNQMHTYKTYRNGDKSGRLYKGGDGAIPSWFT